MKANGIVGAVSIVLITTREKLEFWIHAWDVDGKFVLTTLYMYENGHPNNGGQWESESERRVELGG